MREGVSSLLEKSVKRVIYFSRFIRQTLQSNRGAFGTISICIRLFFISSRVKNHLADQIVSSIVFIVAGKSSSKGNRR